MRLLTTVFLLGALALSGWAWAGADNCATVLSFAAFKEVREGRQMEALLGRLHLLQMDARYKEPLKSASMQCYDPNYRIPDVHIAVLIRLGFANSFGRVQDSFCSALERDLDALTAALEEYIQRHDPPSLQKFKEQRLDSDRFF